MTTAPTPSLTAESTAPAQPLLTNTAETPEAAKESGVKSNLKVATKRTPRKSAAVETKVDATASDKDAKGKKPKLVRDSFTIPKDEYAVIETLKQRSAKLGQATKKSELLRAGLKALSSMSDAALLKALQAVPSIKTGRPRTEKPAVDTATKPTVKATRK